MDKVTQKAKLPEALAGLDKPNLVALAYSLRHPETWPAGFHWDFSYCQKCAMELARRLWNLSEEKFTNDTGPSEMARTFAMPYASVMDIFMGRGEWAPIKESGILWWKIEDADFKSVTPEMVADQIDKYLADAE